jgi:hypothetical protein
MKFQRDKYQSTEADLLGEFYWQARNAGLVVYLEVYMPSTAHRSGEMRVDAVVVDDDEIICCVEVKRQGRVIPAESRQSRAYAYLERDHRIQTIWVNDFAGIAEIVSDIRNLLDSGVAGQLPRPRRDLVAGAGTPSAP